MNNNTYTKLEKDKVSKILKILSSKINKSIILDDDMIIMANSLSFYPGYSLLEIINNKSVPILKLYALYNDKKEKIEVIDWSNDLIFTLNENIPIKLNDNNIVKYTKFFLNFVKGKHGKFKIIEYLDDIDWKDNPPPSSKQAIGNLIKPLEIVSKNNNSYTLSATIIFKNSLFNAKINIDDKGDLEIFDEKITLESLPVYQEKIG